MSVPARRSATIVLAGPLGRDELELALARAGRQLADGCEELCCCVAGLEADAAAVEALARLALLARRGGCRVSLRGPSAQLLALLELVGLSEALGALSPGAAAGRTGGRASPSRGRT
jgi:ABC-type transporter Mla MlaB component